MNSMCQSIYTTILDLDSLHFTQMTTLCLGDSMVFANQVYKEEGIYYDTVSGTCDSFLTIIVDVDTVSPVITEDQLVLTSTTGTGYQWYMDNQLIPGANFQTYAPQITGEYYVEVTTNGCTGISNTIFVVIPEGINEGNLHAV